MSYVTRAAIRIMKLHHVFRLIPCSVNFTILLMLPLSYRNGYTVLPVVSILLHWNRGIQSLTWYMDLIGALNNFLAVFQNRTLHWRNMDVKHLKSLANRLLSHNSCMLTAKPRIIRHLSGKSIGHPLPMDSLTKDDWCGKGFHVGTSLDLNGASKTS